MGQLSAVRFGPSADAERVTCRVKHHTSQCRVRLMLRCRSAVLLELRLGLSEVIDKEVQVNLHRDIRGRPCRRPVVLDLTEDHQLSARPEPGGACITSDDLSSACSLVESGNGRSILAVDNDSPEIENRRHIFPFISAGRPGVGRATSVPERPGTAVSSGHRR